MIFPWIEDYFGPENDAWKKTCEKEMSEVDENEDDGISDEDDKDFDNSVEFVEENGRIGQQKDKRVRNTQLKLQRSTDAAKRGFLRLLVRCRRIILQDAAVYLHFKKENTFVNSKMRNGSGHNLFITADFKNFQGEVIEAINTPSVNRLQEYEGLVPDIVDSQMEVSNRLGEINHRMTREQQKNNSQLNRIEDSLNKHCQDSSRIESILIGLTQQLQQISRNQQVLLMNQHLVNSQVQLLMASNMSSNSSNNQNNPIQPFFSAPIPISSQPLPTSTPPLLPQVAIQPSAPIINNSENTSRLSASKGKKRARWVSYNPQDST